MNINEWLLEAPAPNEISINPDGSEFLDIRVVEDKLNQLTDSNWGVENFKFKIITINDVILFSGSAEILVNYDSRCRRITGAFTDIISNYTNNIDLEATCLSECIKNGSKRLGNQFGRLLNTKPEKKERTKVKMRPDKKIRQDYASAIAGQNTEMVSMLEKIYDFTLKQY
jgi:hypothetical protein